jgi:hypothetical protein
LNRRAGGWELVQPDELDPQLKALKGRRAGLAKRLPLLEADPCDPTLNAYRLSGPLAPIVCGIHLDRGYRLAFTTQQALTDEDRPRLVLLYVGKREPGHRRQSSPDIWDDLHGLFGVDNPPSAHDKPNCCADGLPTLDDGQLVQFLKRLRQFNRGR